MSSQTGTTRSSPAKRNSLCFAGTTNSFISEEDIEADVEEELEAGWWDSFNLEFEEHSDADEETTETNPDAQPELTEPLSSPSGVTKTAPWANLSDDFA
jgi:hypothetical protein